MIFKLLRKPLVLLTLIITAVWAQSLANDFVHWDDLDMIVRNPMFNPPTWAGVGWYWVHPAWNLYQPLTTTLWAGLAWVGWVRTPDAFGGHMNPAVFHLAGIVLHLATALFLFQILQLAVRNQTAALLGALLFAVHPIQTEAVAFAGVLNNALAGCFSLLAIWQYLILTDPLTSLPRASRIGRWTIGSLALVLAMLAKPSVVVTAPIALILDLAIHHRWLRAATRSILPWVLLEIPCVIATKLIQHGADAARLPLRYRPFIFGDTTCFYIGKIFWPAQLAIDYGRSPEFVRDHPLVWVNLPIAMVVIAAIFFLRKKYSLPAAGGAIFIVALLPNSGLIPFDFQLISTVADRYAYLGMIGIALIAASLAAKFPLLRIGLILLLIVLAIRTEFQLATWRDSQSLYNNALAVNPLSWLSDGNLANAIADTDPDRAIDLCRRSINIRGDRPDVWNTLGTLLIPRGQYREAITAFETAHALAPDDPIFASNLAQARADIAKHRAK
jgi:hypothetical protein